MKSPLIVTGYLALAAWLFAMVFPVFPDPRIYTGGSSSGFNIIFDPFHYDWGTQGLTNAWTVTVLLLGYAITVLSVGNSKK